MDARLPGTRTWFNSLQGPACGGLGCAARSAYRLHVPPSHWTAVLQQRPQRGPPNNKGVVVFTMQGRGLAGALPPAHGTVQLVQVL